VDSKQLDLRHRHEATWTAWKREHNKAYGADEVAMTAGGTGEGKEGGIPVI
jgi:hypothetical protein